MKLSIPSFDSKYTTYFLVAAVLLLVGSVSFSTVQIGTSWEVDNGISKVIVNGKTYATQADVSDPGSVSSWGYKHIIFDPDAEYTGVADLDITVTNPAHVALDRMTGDWVSSDDAVPFDSYSKVVSDRQVFYEQHVYSFVLTVIANPDILHNGLWSTVEGKNGGGTLANINVFVMFSLDAWDIGPASFTAAGETYIKETGWYGIMSASVITVEAGLVLPGANPLSGYDASATETSALNMYVDDSIQKDWSSAADADQYDIISGIPTTVDISLFGQLQPGYTWPLGGSISAYAVQFRYTVRVDTLITASYYLASGNQPTTAQNASIIHEGADPLADLGAWLGSLLPGFGLGLGSIAVFVVVVLVLVLLIRRGRGGTN